MSAYSISTGEPQGEDPTLRDYRCANPECVEFGKDKRRRFQLMNEYTCVQCHAVLKLVPRPKLR